MVVVMLGAAMAPGYDFHGGAICDLGVIGATATMFNAPLFVGGLFDLLGGHYCYKSDGKRWRLAIFAIAGIGAAPARIFTLDSSGIHGLFALVGFLFFNVQALDRAIRVSGAMRAISVLAGLVGLAFVVVMAIGDAGNTAVFGPIGHGGAERTIVYPPMLWLLAFGGYLLGSAGVEPIGVSGAEPESAD
jgi:hypothetical membrane protein